MCLETHLSIFHFISAHSINNTLVTVCHICLNRRWTGSKPHAPHLQQHNTHRKRRRVLVTPFTPGIEPEYIQTGTKEAQSQNFGGATTYNRNPARRETTKFGFVVWCVYTRGGIPASACISPIIELLRYIGPEHRQNDFNRRRPHTYLFAHDRTPNLTLNADKIRGKKTRGEKIALNIKHQPQNEWSFHFWSEPNHINGIASPSSSCRKEPTIEPNTSPFSLSFGYYIPRE